MGSSYGLKNDPAANQKADQKHSNELIAHPSGENVMTCKKVSKQPGTPQVLWKRRDGGTNMFTSV